MPRKRIDSLLVERGLAGTRAKAQALLMAGNVLVGDRPVTKAGTLVPAGATVRLRGLLPYVSRGGFKLAHALDCFGIDVRGTVAIDIGASTGGFTDCLLQRGASRVYAIDVGRGQLDERLRRDRRVVALEKVNARNPLPVPEQAGLAVIDVSFISATMVLPGAAAALKPGGEIVLLLKPQFEARRGEAGPLPRVFGGTRSAASVGAMRGRAKGGLIKDPALHALILGRFIAWAVDNRFRLCGLTTSPIAGASGNKEFLVLLRPVLSPL